MSRAAYRNLRAQSARGEEGLFGTEKSQRSAPPSREPGGRELRPRPLPADTAFKRAIAGEFDGVVAMYHDQGHIAIKLVGQNRAVNVTVGLPSCAQAPATDCLRYRLARRGAR